MTTPQKPLLPETNNPAQTATPLPWYRSGIVWLGIFTTLLILAGCIHFVIVTRAYMQPESPEPAKKELTHFKGMQLFADPAPAKDDTAAKADAQ